MNNNQTTAPNDQARPRLALVPTVADKGDNVVLRSLIRPLPRSVLPSQVFLARLRGRLLDLPGEQQGAGRAA